MARYGTNSNQVEQFVQRLRGLSEDQWETVLVSSDKCALAFGPFETDSVELELYRTYGASDANKMLSKALQDAGLTRGPGGRWGLTATAVMALMAPTSMLKRQFAAAYGPFATIIPVSDLGSGAAPQIGPPPESPLKRFLIRLEGFPHQQAVVDVALSLQTLVGAEAIDKKIDEAVALVDLDELEHANTAISSVMASEVDKLTELFAMVAKRVGISDDRVKQQSNFYEGQREPFIKAARRAALALAVRDWLSPADFALLYLPFEAFIPAESLG